MASILGKPGGPGQFPTHDLSTVMGALQSGQIADAPLVRANRVSAWRVWQTEHTVGGIQERRKKRGSRGGNCLKGWMLAVPRCSGAFSSEHFWDRWAATVGRYEGATARKRPCRSRWL